MLNIENKPETLISVPLNDWEEKVRDQRSLEILTTLIQAKKHIEMDTVKVICGLQIEEPEVPEGFEFLENPDEIPLPCLDEPEESSNIPIPCSMPDEENPPPRCLRTGARGK
ncbi:MAG: hypothetical protein KH828_07695 [Clostridiales bacterium]|nr:hypothetical protein [Clostridiales bacterium]